LLALPASTSFLLTVPDDWLYGGIQPNGKPMKFKQGFFMTVMSAGKIRTFSPIHGRSPRFKLTTPEILIGKGPAMLGFFYFYSMAPLPCLKLTETDRNWASYIRSKPLNDTPRNGSFEEIF
jgi:hypothetical protein